MLSYCGSCWDAVHVVPPFHLHKKLVWGDEENPEENPEINAANEGDTITIEPMHAIKDGNTDINYNFYMNIYTITNSSTSVRICSFILISPNY